MNDRNRSLITARLNEIPKIMKKITQAWFDFHVAIGIPANNSGELRIKAQIMIDHTNECLQRLKEIMSLIDK